MKCQTNQFNCPVEATLSLIGGKYKPLSPHRQQRPVCRPHPLPHGGRRRHRQLGLPPDRRGQAHRRKGRRPESHGQDGKGCRVVGQEWQLLAQDDRNDAQVPRRRLLCPRRVSGGPDGRQHRLRGRRWRRRGRGCGPCLMLLR